MADFITADDFAKATVKPVTMKNSYRNNKCVWIMPTRGMIPLRVHVSLRNMAWLPNVARVCLEEEGYEVSEAYNKLVGTVMASKECDSFPFIWTYEEDNIQPRDTFQKLFDAIWTCIDCGVPMPQTKDGSPAEPWVCQNGHKGLDAVGGLYRTKSDPSMYMAFGDVNSGVLDFRPLNVADAEAEGRIVEVNGLAMGCTLWRKDLFGKVTKPWFRTINGSEEDGPEASYTQDLYFARKAKEEAQARFAVHCGVSVGHLDVATGQVY